MRAGGTVKPCRGTGSWPGRRDAHCKLYPRIRLAALVVVSVVGLAGSSSDEPQVTVLENVEREDRLPSPGGTWTRPRQPGPTYVAPAWHLNADQQLDFYTGLSFFRSPWVTAPSSTTARDGLGPLFNSHSCEGCHKNGGRGRSLLDDPHALATVVRISVENSDGTVGPHARYGWQLQVKATYRREGEASLAMKSEAVSVAGAPGTLRRPRLEITPHDPGEDPADWQMSARVAPALLGMGLLAAIPQSDLLDNADPDDLDQDGISGRPHWRGNGASRAIGRFGWKALHATVAAQTGAALRDDIGITNPEVVESGCTEAQVNCRAAPRLTVTIRMKGWRSRASCSTTWCTSCHIFPRRKAAGSRNVSDAGRAHLPASAARPAMSRISIRNTDASGPMRTCCCTTWAMASPITGPKATPRVRNGVRHRYGESARRRKYPVIPPSCTTGAPATSAKQFTGTVAKRQGRALRTTGCRTRCRRMSWPSCSPCSTRNINLISMETQAG